jgi:uncharacterized protein YgiB involved in biofilm formation
MKRSTQIGLAAVGVVLVASLWPRSEEPEESLVYNSLADCRAAGQLTGTQCEQRFNEASANHLRDAKKFGNTSQCEAEYGTGSCQSAVWNGAQVVIPALAGIMLARAFAQGGGAAAPLLPPTRAACPPGSTVEGCQPARSSSSSSSTSGSSGGYRSSGSSSRAYSTTSGDTVVARSGSTPGSATTHSASSRGGFGSTSHSYNSSSSS